MSNIEPPEQPHIVFVLGMHRSGTSLISRVVNLLGYHLGADEHLMVPTQFNPNGYWENQLLTDLNDEILARLGGTWCEPPAFPDGWEHSDELADLRCKASTIIETEFKGISSWSWKDPRNCLTLPFWQSLLPPLRCIIVIRNPIDVARSLEHRDGLSFRQAAFLWLLHVRGSLVNSAGYDRIILFYEDLMRNGASELERLCSFLQAGAAKSDPEIQRVIYRTIDETLYHHRADFLEIVGHPELAFPAKALYSLLRLWRSNAERGSEQRMAAAITELSEGAARASAEVLAMESEAAELKQSASRQEQAGARRELEIARLRNEQRALAHRLTNLEDLLLAKDEELANLAHEQEELANLAREQGERWLELNKENEKIRAEMAQQESALQHQHMALDLVQGSLGWLLTSKFRMIKDRYLLPGTRRRLIYDRWLMQTKTRLRHRRPGFLDEPSRNSGEPLRLNTPNVVLRHGHTPTGYSENQFAIYSNSQGNFFFAEIRDLIAAGLRGLGYKVAVCDERVGFLPTADWHIVVAPHEFFTLGSVLSEANIPQNLILVNTEQPSTQWYETARFYFPLAAKIWDINRTSTDTLAAQHYSCEFLQLGYLENFSLLQEVRELPSNDATLLLEDEIRGRSYFDRPLAQRPIDVLFLGTRSLRREQILAYCAPVFSEYRCFLYIPEPSAPLIPGLTTHLDTRASAGLSQRSKIVLNVHRGEDRYFEWHRIVMHGIWQRTLVISEPCDVPAPFDPGLDYVEASSSEIPGKVQYYLSSTAGREEAQTIIEHGFQKLTNDCSLTEGLARAVAPLRLPAEERASSVRIGSSSS